MGFPWSCNWMDPSEGCGEYAGAFLWNVVPRISHLSWTSTPLWTTEMTAGLTSLSPSKRGAVNVMS